jgi:hypothetical protein
MTFFGYILLKHSDGVIWMLTKDYGTRRAFSTNCALDRPVWRLRTQNLRNYPCYAAFVN